MGDEVRHNNSASAAGDPVVRVQVIDSAGAILSTFPVSSTPSKFKTLSGASSPTTAWTPASGKKFRIMGWTLTTSATTVVTLTDTGTAGSAPFVIPVIVGAPSISPALGNGFLSSTADNTLVVTTGSGTVSGTIYGTEE